MTLNEQQESKEKNKLRSLVTSKEKSIKRRDEIIEELSVKNLELQKEVYRLQERIKVLELEHERI